MAHEPPSANEHAIRRVLSDDGRLSLHTPSVATALAEVRLWDCPQASWLWIHHAHGARILPLGIGAGVHEFDVFAEAAAFDRSIRCWRVESGRARCIGLGVAKAYVHSQPALVLDETGSMLFYRRDSAVAFRVLTRCAAQFGSVKTGCGGPGGCEVSFVDAMPWSKLSNIDHPAQGRLAGMQMLRALREIAREVVRQRCSGPGHECSIWVNGQRLDELAGQLRCLHKATRKDDLEISCEMV